eukprot:jgi/Picsp_1/4505/NSC_06726-R1_nadh dehydrogenase subunit 4l
MAILLYALLLLLGLDFFAMTFLVVYVGAIAVLFLFVVMMLNINLAEIQERRLRYLPVGDDVVGQVFALYVLTVAAAESAIGLALLVMYYRIRGSIQVEYINLIRG